MTCKVNNRVESESDLRMNRKGNEPFKISKELAEQIENI